VDSDINIRSAVLEDAETLAVLAIQVWLTTYAFDGIHPSFARYLSNVFTTAEFSRLIGDANTVILVAERDRHLIGFIQVAVGQSTPLSNSERQAEISHLYVQGPFCGNGLGSLLLRKAEQRLVQLGIPTVWLTTWYANERARKFYAKHKYEDRGEAYFELDNERHQNRVFIKSLAQ
jgi:ribosomal protein S18 acetylase RimI-like enzyme